MREKRETLLTQTPREEASAFQIRTHYNGRTFNNPNTFLAIISVFFSQFLSLRRLWVILLLPHRACELKTHVDLVSNSIISLFFFTGYSNTKTLCNCGVYTFEEG